MHRHISLRFIAVVVVLLAAIADAETPNRVTILYDSFGKAPALTVDWGFAALVEYGGQRILFDTGNNAALFEHNVKALGVDLRNIDFVVISHRHADHTSGITYLLTVNPKHSHENRSASPHRTSNKSPLQTAASSLVQASGDALANTGDGKV